MYVFGEINKINVTKNSFYNFSNVRNLATEQNCDFMPVPQCFAYCSILIYSSQEV
jgi:hypothetical protein